MQEVDDLIVVVLHRLAHDIEITAAIREGLTQAKRALSAPDPDFTQASTILQGLVSRAKRLRIRTLSAFARDHAKDYTKISQLRGFVDTWHTTFSGINLIQFDEYFDHEEIKESITRLRTILSPASEVCISLYRVFFPRHVVRGALLKRRRVKGR